MVEKISTKYQAKFDESDIVQQTMLEACAGLDSVRARSERELAGWLRKMLSRNVLDAVRRLRSHKRSIARETSLNVGAADSMSVPGIQVAAEVTPPSRQFAKAEDLDQMRAAIERLPAAQRDAVSLHHLEGLSLAEVAERMQRSTSAVAGLLHRGLSALKQEMGEL